MTAPATVIQGRAVMWTGANTTAVINWALERSRYALRWHEAEGAEPEHLSVDTPHGTVRAALGDLVLVAHTGDLYVLKLHRGPAVESLNYSTHAGDTFTAHLDTTGDRS